MTRSGGRRKVGTTGGLPGGSTDSSSDVADVAGDTCESNPFRYLIFCKQAEGFICWP
jgi:hypothetical protein